jgi:hypothetical protein
MVMNQDSHIKIRTAIPSLFTIIQKNTMSETQSNKPKYVVLEHKTLPDRGFRFWTSNVGDINSEWYSVVDYTDSEDVAIALSRKANYAIVPTIQELEDYWRDEIIKRNQTC